MEFQNIEMNKVVIENVELRGFLKELNIIKKKLIDDKEKFLAAMKDKINLMDNELKEAVSIKNVL